MKKETLQDRIEKLEANISKKQTLIQKMKDRITKNTAKLQKMGYTDEQITEGVHNPYRMDRTNPNYDKAFDICYSISNAKDSILNAEKALPEMQEKLTGYQIELQILLEKENSRNIKPILDFLEGWKQKVTKFYLSSVDGWVESLQKYHEEDKKFHKWYWGQDRGIRRNEELVKKMEAPLKEAKEHHAMFSFLDRYMTKQDDVYVLDTDLLKKDLDYEATLKYDFIVERTNQIVGQITDATNLCIGHKGDLNGYIIGTRGKAKVQTIGAGGWNIQCYHFRTLINEMK